MGCVYGHAVFVALLALIGSPPPPCGVGRGKRGRLPAAEAEATWNNRGVAIAIVDSGGHLVMLHHLDSTQIASIRIAERKACTALEFC